MRASHRKVNSASTTGITINTGSTPPPWRFPWLEGTIRYTDVRTRKYSQWEDFSGDQSYKDKSFDFKLRLWEEGYWLPQVAFGKRDIAGTGLFDGEYLVASKQAGPFDFTLGMAWLRR